MSTVIALLIWGVVALGNPADVVGVIYYKDGTIKRTAVFPRYSDYEEWYDLQLKQYGNEINYISYELYIED